jgi:hypothetical protein
VSAVPITGLGWARRILSGVVCVSALALVMAKTGSPAPSAERVGLISAFFLVLSLIALGEVARREHAEAEHASAERERRQLAMFKLQVELAKAKAPAPSATAAPAPQAEDNRAEPRTAR